MTAAVFKEEKITKNCNNNIPILESLNSSGFLLHIFSVVFNLYGVHTGRIFQPTLASYFLPFQHYWFTFIFTLFWSGYSCPPLFPWYFSAFPSTVISILPLCSSVKHKYRLLCFSFSLSLSPAVSLPFSSPPSVFISPEAEQCGAGLTLMLEPLCSGIILELPTICPNNSWKHQIQAPKPAEEGWDKQREAPRFAVGVHLYVEYVHGWQAVTCGCHNRSQSLIAALTDLDSELIPGGDGTHTCRHVCMQIAACSLTAQTEADKNTICVPGLRRK